MSSTQIALPIKTWIQVTTTDKEGSIRHQTGNTSVFFTEAPLIPVGIDTDTPIMETTEKGDVFPYYNVPATDFLWAYATSDDAVITVSPGEA